MFQLREVIQDKVYNPPLPVLNRYLFTRKKERTIAGITLPGLLSVYSFHETLLGFVMIFVLEFAATILAINEGLDPLMVVVLIVVDFVLALLAHVPVRRELIARNQRIIEQNQFNLDRIDKQIKSSSRFKYFMDFLIVGSAAAKIFFAWLIVVPFSPLGIFIAVAYLIAGLLHILCTGDFFHGLWLSVRNKRYFGEFKDTNGKEHLADTIYEDLDGIGYVEGPDENFSPRIEKRNDGGFQLVSHGVMDDNDLYRLILRQRDSDVQIHIIKKGIKMQLKAIGALHQDKMAKVHEFK